MKKTSKPGLNRVVGSAGILFAFPVLILSIFGFSSPEYHSGDPSFWIQEFLNLNAPQPLQNQNIASGDSLGTQPSQGTGLPLLSDSLFAEKKNTDSSQSAIKSVDSVGQKATLPLIKINPDQIGLRSFTPLLDSIKKEVAKRFGKQGTVDSILAVQDSLRKMDTMKIDRAKLDSTARLKYLKYKPKDSYTLSMYTPYNSKFFATPSQKKRTIEIDSTGKYVVIKDKVGDQKVKYPLRFTLDEYIAMKLKTHDEEAWDKLVSKYELKDGKRDLGNLIKDITDIEIPLPSVGVLSIFGTPKIKLNISGSVDIHAAWRNETTEGVTASGLGNSRNEPDFKQQVQINVDGTIGDKLHISADWNTERTFEYENQLKIKYTGYEDEIVQSVEAGNVSLQGASLVGSSDALFGVKAAFQLGPLTLTAVASQKKGETKEKELSGGASSAKFTIHPNEYRMNKFFVDTIYAGTTLNIFNNRYGKAEPVVYEALVIRDIEVWKSVQQTTQVADLREGIAYFGLPPVVTGSKYNDSYRNSNQIVTGEIVRGRFRRLTVGDEYTVDVNTGFITLKSEPLADDIIAVAYKINGTDGTGLTYGEFTASQTDKNTLLVLKLVKPANLQPDYQAWKLMLKNSYSLGVSQVKQDGFKLDILYQADGTDPQNSLGGVRLLQAFGFDNSGPNRTGGPDGVFDFEDRFINRDLGEIMFPVLEPFGRDLPSSIPRADELRFTTLYTKDKTTALNLDAAKNKFVIQGESAGSRSSSYDIGFNVVENSVKVLLNGRELTNGVDYSVDYSMGKLTIKNDAALSPGANLKISYEENDLFQMASKSLFGLRGMFDISRQTKLGFTYLTLSQQTLSDKVRIGEEPISNTIYGIDFTTQGDLPFLTRWLDKIISTKEMSTFAIRAEAAMMNPNPNTKTSSITSDNSSSIAYIDDFESSKKTIPIGIGYTSWHDVSPPALMYPEINALDNITKMNFKAKTYWYNVLPYSGVQVRDIWPQRKVASTDQNVTVLDFVVDPDLDKRGQYNYTPDKSGKQKRWGGMMKLLSSTASNLNSDKYDYIEFWGNVAEAPSGAKLYIDMGEISENVYPYTNLYGKPHTEDTLGNQLLQPGLDIGLDMMSDAQERAAHPDAVDQNDPSGDNFSYSAGNYENINGTEGNGVNTDAGRIPDTEDLNLNGSLDMTNSYFVFEVPLDTNRATNKYIVGGQNNWRLYRIPLTDFKQRVGNPSLNNVRTIRLYTYNNTERVHLRLTELNIVGNQWLAVETDTANPHLKLSVVSVEDNPEYISPGGVQRERDRTRPDVEIYRNEQSLSMTFTNVADGQRSMAVKSLVPRTLDVFNYSQMKLFIHTDYNTGPSSLAYYVDENHYNTDVFFRFGTDTGNYYEYRQPLQENPFDNNWSEISIDFKQISALKNTRNDAKTEYKVEVPGKPGHYYVIKGNPALTQISQFWVGIINRPDSDPVNQRPISGTIWVNELRVIGADNTKGWAYNGALSLKMADLMSLNYTYSRQDPFFHRLNDRFGTRNESVSWGFSADVDFLKLIPTEDKENVLRLSYSHTEGIGKPLYLPGTDVKVSESVTLTKLQLMQSGMSEEMAGKLAQQIQTNSETINISDSWTAPTIKMKIPSNYWLIRDTWNSTSFSFNYNKTYGRNPTTEDARTWMWNASMNYSLAISPDYSFTPADLPILSYIYGIFPEYKSHKIYFLPQSFTFSVNARRSRSYTTSRKTDFADSRTAVMRDFGTTRNMGINWKVTEAGFWNISINYSNSFASSLLYVETDSSDQQRRESAIWKKILTSAFFGKDYQYAQNFDFRTAPQLPDFWGLNKNVSLTAGYQAQYNWNNNLNQPERGRSIGVTSGITLGLNLKFKAMLEPIFGDGNSPSVSMDRGGRPLGETTTVAYQDTGSAKGKDTSNKFFSRLMAIQNLWAAVKGLGRAVFVDYENIRINYSNKSQFSANGIRAEGSGFSNMFTIKSDYSAAPSRQFMLGLSQYPGPRSVNTEGLQDNISYANNVDFATSKPLWEGARLEINWKTGWSQSDSRIYRSDEKGTLSLVSQTQTGTLSRSFFSLPPVFIFSSFRSGIKRVNELHTQSNKSLSDAFVEGFESLPWFNQVGFMKNMAKYMPRANWRFNWDGLEKFSIFKSFAKRVSVDHSYNSDYSEGWKLNQDGNREITSQKVTYGFQPLVGVNITFNDLWSGNFSGNVKYSTRSGFDLATTTNNITEDFSKDLGITLSFAKSGFEIPMFGLSLKNDVEISIAFTSTHTSLIQYDMTNFTENGIPQNGSIKTSLEPRVKYVMSSRVNVSFYYKRTTTEPEGASKVPPTTTNEAGLDVRIAIQP
ncbi:MAG: cell surface protein SprA [Ignavibacteria bacterium]|nr:cell surface protein SprA [Ignavibacteria bacterium]